MNKIIIQLFYTLFGVLYKCIKKVKSEKKVLDFNKVGINFEFDSFSKFIRPELITIGDNVYIGPRSYISSEGLIIKDNVMIGPELIIQGNDHIYDSVGIVMKENKEKIKKEIIINSDVWIGARVTILKGVTVGEGSVIGTGSVVTKNVPPYCIALGVPSKNVKKRFSDNELVEHLKIMGENKNYIASIISKRNEYFEPSEYKLR